MATIRGRLAAMTAILIAGISVFIYLYFPSSLEERARQAIVAKGQTLSEMLAYSIGPAVPGEDVRVMDGALDAPLGDKDLIFIVIVNDSGRVVSAAREGIADRLDYLHAAENNNLSKDGNTYIVKTPIRTNDREIGQIYLGLSLKEVRSAVASSKVTMLGLSLLVFVVGMVCVYGISTVITSPLRDMIRTVEQISHGDLSRRAEVPSLREVKQLAESFNMMVENVERRAEELHEEILQRGRVEEALRGSESRYRLLFDGNPYPLCVYETETLKFLAVNNAAVEQYGYSPEEFSSMTIRDLDPLNGRAQQGILPGEKPSGGITPHRRKNGSIFSVETTSHELQYEGKRARLMLANDVTERERAQEQLREQAALLDITSDAIIVRDLSDRILYWNKGAERSFGWMATKALGMESKTLLCSKGEAADYAAATRVLLKQGEWRGELRLVNQKAEKLVFESRWTIVRDDAGNPKSILTINTDITERKKLEEQFLRSQRMQSLGTLAGGIAHDLNNVLAPMMLALHVFRRRFTDAGTVKLLDALETSTKRGADIVKQVLTFARGFEGEKSDIRIGHLIKEFEKMICDTFPRMIQIKTFIAKDVWTVSGDYTQLYQVLMNLCVNARDAMPNGGTLVIEADNMYVDDKSVKVHSDAQPGPYVVLTVADTGTGMPPGIVDKIFEPFFTTKEVGKGTGLGLSTALGILKSHGGFINVYSEAAKGSRFKIYLPALESAEVKEAIKELSLIPNGKGELVLVVDDEPAIRELNKLTLEEHGYRVMTANDGTEACALGAQHKGKIDLVITDMMMPFMDGPSTIRALRKLDPDLKFLVVSGLVEDQMLTEESAQGAIPVLTKPFSTDKLLIMLREILAD
ncbi:MAG TPA: PAS domain S-box protein [Bacteroidota bacterium]|nr:PAS domain S-box protein [Bacteroidota bacterium]